MKHKKNIYIYIFFQSTDITQHALDRLSSSRVNKIYLIGRRGPLQAAFTIKELREMLKLTKCQTIWRQSDFYGVEESLLKLARPRKRLTELMLKSLGEKPSENYINEFRPIFQRSPLEIIGNTKVESITLGENQLEGEDLLNKQAVLTSMKESLKCSLAVSSIGYKSVQCDDQIPFDIKKGVAKHNRFKIDKSLYTSGWLATGPTGVILTTMSNAFEVADIIVRDIELEGLLKENKGGSHIILKQLQKNNVQVVNWDGWEKIDKYEQEQGAKVGKPREKIIIIKKMLEIASHI